MPTIRDEIAKNLLYYRKKANLTQKELAEKLGVKNSSVSNWENGLNSIDIDTLAIACDVFGVTFNDMYGKYVKSEGNISLEAKEMAKLYDMASDDDKCIVHLALKKYDTKTEKGLNAESSDKRVM